MMYLFFILVIIIFFPVTLFRDTVTPTLGRIIILSRGFENPTSLQARPTRRTITTFVTLLGSQWSEGPIGLYNDVYFSLTLSFFFLFFCGEFFFTYQDVFTILESFSRRLGKNYRQIE